MSDIGEGFFNALRDGKDVPFALPNLITITVELPFPPSVNAIWRVAKAKGGRTYLAPEYKIWKLQADLVATAHKHGPFHTIRGPFSAHVWLDETQGWGRMDGDNRVKALLDWAQSRELIADDKWCRRGTWEWTAHANAPEGCRLTLREICK